MMKDRPFHTVGISDKGYDIEEVDDFLRRVKDTYNGPLTPVFDKNTVRSTAFNRACNGYVPAKIDDALDKLGAAFVQKRGALVVVDRGKKAWLNTIYQDAKSLYPRLLRPVGHRLREADGWGYSKIEIDELIDRLSDYLDGKTDLSAREVREAVFGLAKDSHAHDESVVDAYLERAASVPLSVK